MSSTSTNKPSIVYNDHWDYFVKERNESIAKISDPTNNLIIRLDKLINDFQQQKLEWASRKDFERHIVPWSDNSGDCCELCRTRFTITRRRHHCRLCGTQLCGTCSQFLTFKSAQKLTGLDSSLVSSTLMALSNGDDGISGGVFGNVSLSVDKPMAKSVVGHVERNLSLQNLGNSFTAMTHKLGSMITRNGSGPENAGEEGASLRICRNCKSLLERRERAMELRWENNAFVEVYQKLCNLLFQITQLASSYRNMAESLNNGETMYSLNTATTVRLKLKNLQEEIIGLSDKIERWTEQNGGSSSPTSTHLSSRRELQLQKNIKMLALHTLHDMVNVGPDLPTLEEYEALKQRYQQRLQRRLEKESQVLLNSESDERNNSPPSTTTTNFLKSASILTRKMAPRDRPCSSSFSEVSTSGDSSDLGTGSRPSKRREGGGTQRRDERLMRQSSSFTGMVSAEESWMPFENPIKEQKRNPFLQEELKELHPLQEQYLISKSFLEQATLAGRLDEVRILERNLRELEQELDRLELSKPNEL